MCRADHRSRAWTPVGCCARPANGGSPGTLCSVPGFTRVHAGAQGCLHVGLVPDAHSEPRVSALTTQPATRPVPPLLFLQVRSPASPEVSRVTWSSPGQPMWLPGLFPTDPRLPVSEATSVERTLRTWRRVGPGEGGDGDSEVWGGKPSRGPQWTPCGWEPVAHCVDRQVPGWVVRQSPIRCTQ